MVRRSGRAIRLEACVKLCLPNSAFCSEMFFFLLILVLYNWFSLPVFSECIKYIFGLCYVKVEGEMVSCDSAAASIDQRRHA